MRASFKIITSDNKEHIEEQITTHLQMGFKLNGGLQVVVCLGDTNPVKYFQSIFYIEEENK
jgi:hypothetical protein